MQNLMMGNGSSLEYLGTDSTLYYSSYELKSAVGWQDLIDLTNTINNNASNIESILDIDRAIEVSAFKDEGVNRLKDELLNLIP